MNCETRLHALLLDEGETVGLDALAASVAIFGADRIELAEAPDRAALSAMADALAEAGAEAVVVVDVDRHSEPKHVLADAADTGFPLAVLTDGRNDVIRGHALSVDAAGYLPTSLPARELVDQLAALAGPRLTFPRL